MEEEVKIQIDPSRLNTLVIGNTTFRSANDYELSHRDIEQARLELKETEDVRNTCLHKLKEMLSRDQETKYRTDDAYLLRFLRYKKFNSEEAYKSIRNFNSIRKDYPQLFSLPSNLEYLLNIGLFTYLPFRDDEGSIIFVNKYGKWNTDEVKVCDLFQLFQVIVDVINMNPSCQINGIIAIWDFENLRTCHVTEGMHPSTLKLWTKMTQELYPWRVKRIIVLHCNRLLYAAFTVIRMLLKKKISDRITILQSDMSKLHEIVNPVLLPKEYGGSLDENDCNITQHIMDNLPYLKYERSFSNV